MAELSNDVMISTCICFDALLTAGVVKILQRDGETFTFHCVFPSQHVLVSTCYQEDTLDDKAHFSTSAYTFIVVHLFYNVHIDIEYEITDDNGLCSGVDQSIVHLRLLSYVMSMNVNRLKEKKENPLSDVGETGESDACESHYDADDELDLTSDCVYEHYDDEESEYEYSDDERYDDYESDYMYEPYDPYGEEESDPIPYDYYDELPHHYFDDVSPYEHYDGFDDDEILYHGDWKYENPSNINSNFN